MQVPALVAAVSFTLAACASGASAAPRADYDVTLLPGSKSVVVVGRTNLAREQVTGWIAGAGGLGSATTLPSDAGSFQFAYAVSIPELERSNSSESEIDDERFRSWGSGIFLVPEIKEGEVGPIGVCLTGPADWVIATSAGAARCFEVPDVNALLGLPILAGNIAVHTFPAAGSAVTLALRAGHPVPPAEFQQKLTALVRGASDYLGAPLPKRIFFGVDRRGDRPTYAPGNNITTQHQSATMLIDSDAGSNDGKFWGTYGHEYAHSWIPRGFGNSSVTREELGSVFVEGFTDYLAYRISHAAGVHRRQQLFAALSEFYLEYGEAVERRPKGNPEFLRYRQGMMAAWMLDIELLKASNGRAGFRELMQTLLKRHGGTDGLTRQEVKDALRALGDARVAVLYDTLTDIGRPIDFARHLRGTGIAVRPVEDYTRAIESGEAVVSATSANSAERRFLERWLRG